MEKYHLFPVLFQSHWFEGGGKPSRVECKGRYYGALGNGDLDSVFIVVYLPGGTFVNKIEIKSILHCENKVVFVSILLGAYN